MKLIYLLIPIISALTSWFAIGLIFKYFFYPVHPIKIGSISIQGIFPSQKNQIITAFRNFISLQLKSMPSLENKLSNPEQMDQIMQVIEQHVDHFLKVKLPEQMPMISMFIGEKTTSQLKSVFLEELQIIFPQVIGSYFEQLQKNQIIENSIADSLESLSLETIVPVLHKSVSTSIRKAEYIAALIGFIIGLFELAIFFCC
jgi:uncharacterized membrane-anchored protein YjiN (DUF445 family)